MCKPETNVHSLMWDLLYHSNILILRGTDFWSILRPGKNSFLIHISKMLTIGNICFYLVYILIHFIKSGSESKCERNLWFVFWILDQKWEYVVEKCIENFHCKIGFFLKWNGSSWSDQRPRKKLFDQGKKSRKGGFEILTVRF